MRGLALYERLMAIKPEQLSEYEWAKRAGVNRGFFSDLKAKGVSPKHETILRVLAAIGADASVLDPIPLSTARPFSFEGASMARPVEDLPVYGTALGAAEMVEGEAIEQTTLNRSEVVTYVRRPTILNGRTDVYGLFVVGSSMAPRFEEGEMVVAERRHPHVGDDVVVYLRPLSAEDDGETADAVLVKRLVRRTAAYVELEQFNPRFVFRIPNERVRRVDRVVPWSELLG